MNNTFYPSPRVGFGGRRRRRKTVRGGFGINYDRYQDGNPVARRTATAHAHDADELTTLPQLLSSQLIQNRGQ
jgi:hypothetical protein